MKVTVTEVFIDKYTDEVYEIGQMIDISDDDRVTDLVNRGLVTKAETETKATKRRRKSA